MNWTDSSQMKYKVNKHMKKYSTFLAKKKMQIKGTLWFHLTSVKMSVIKKTSNKCE
jgi:hypothetical protein